MPGRAGGCAGRTGCAGSGRGPPSMLGVVGRGGPWYGGRAAPGSGGRAGPPAGAAGRAPAGGAGAAGFTMRCWPICGRFAGASGRGGWGTRPGSSMRRRSVGGTNRPGAGAGASAGAGGASTMLGVSSVTATGGGSGVGSSTTSTGSATSAAGASGSSTTSATGAAGGSASSCGSSAGGGGASGLTTLTRRGGPSVGAVGFGGSTFFVATAFLPPLAGAGVSENMSPPGSATLR